MLTNRLKIWLSLTLICLTVACQAQRGNHSEKAKTIEYEVSKTPGEREALRAILDVGVLPAKAGLIVKDSEGNILGSAQPYGIMPGNKAGKFIIPLPASLIKDGKVKLHISLEGDSIRPPTDKELEKVEVVIIDITP